MSAMARATSRYTGVSVAAWFVVTMAKLGARLKLHRHERVVVDRLRVGDSAEDTELLERMPDHIDRRRAPGTVAREAGDLRIIDLCSNAGLDLDGPRLRRHDGILVCAHEGNGLEPAA